MFWQMFFTWLVFIPLKAIKGQDKRLGWLLTTTVRTQSPKAGGLSKATESNSSGLSKEAESQISSFYKEAKSKNSGLSKAAESKNSGLSIV